MGNCLAVQEDMDVPHILVVTDIGIDYDDFMALIILGNLHRKRKVKIVGIIATLDPEVRRAQLAKGLLNEMEIYDVPVAYGSRDSDISHPVYGYQFETSFIDETAEFKPHLDLARDILQKAEREERDIRLLSIASLRDVRTIIEDNPRRFLKVVSEIHVQGGALAKDGHLIANDNAANNKRGKEAARFFHEFVEVNNIPCTFYTKDAAFKSTFKPEVFKNSSPDLRAVGEYLCRCHDEQNKTFYNDACNKPLDKDWNREWFLKSRTGKTEKDFPVGCPWDDILKLIKVVPYDPIAALGCAREAVGNPFQPVRIQGLPESARQFLVGETVDGAEVSNIIQRYIAEELTRKKRR
jgi:hypothetical protein